jgi:F-box/leucine-rich repeat protein 2/20
MHSATLQRIIYHAQPFITSMSLRGMDALSGSDLIAALANLGPAEKPTTRLITYRFRLPNLVSIDLRGCKRLSSDDIVTVVLHAPKLRHVNLKGVQGVSSEVIRSLARSAKHIESLDVSRCWDLTLGDIVVFIQLLEYAQAAGIKSLRIAGLKSYGHAAADLLPLLADRLIDLKTLDLAGCSHIHSSDFERWAEVLDDAGRLSSLTHLNISHCRSLTSTTFEHLARRVPDMTRFEMAGLEAAFWTNDWDEQGLIALLRSMPRLQKLDMDAEGLHESISDRVLDVLIPGKYANKVVVGRELVELRIGYAKNVSSEAMIRLVRGCPKLKVLETDVSWTRNLPLNTMSTDISEHKREQRGDARVPPPQSRCRRVHLPR